MCRAEFDYEGWAAYGAWRRGRRGDGRRITEGTRDEVASSSCSSSSSAAADDEDGHTAVEELGCFSECDWPSQCRHRARERLLPPVRGVGMYEVAGAVEYVEVASGAAGENVWGRKEDEESEEAEEDEDEEDEEDEGDEKEEAGAFTVFIWCNGPPTIDPQLLGLHGQADGHWSLAGQCCDDWMNGQDICKGTKL